MNNEIFRMLSSEFSSCATITGMAPVVEAMSGLTTVALKSHLLKFSN